jgi:hypothetical protein
MDSIKLPKTQLYQCGSTQKRMDLKAKEGYWRVREDGVAEMWFQNGFERRSTKCVFIEKADQLTIVESIVDDLEVQELLALQSALPETLKRKFLNFNQLQPAKKKTVKQTSQPKSTDGFGMT